MDIWSILIILGIAQGLFTLSLILLRRKKDSGVNIYLLLIILFFVWLQAEFLSIRNVFNVNVSLFYGTRYGSWLLLGPLVFFYLKSVSQSNWKLQKVDLLHFLPFFVFTLVVPLFYTDFLSFRQVHYGMLTAFDSWEEIITPIQYVYSSVFIIQFVHLACYLFLGFGVIQNYSQKLKASYSFIDHENMTWLNIFNYGLVVILVAAALFLIMFFFTNIYRRHLDYIYVLPMGALIYLVGYKLAGVTFTKVNNSENEAREKYEKSSLKSREAEQYRLVLENYIRDHKPYLDNELRLNSLAQAVNIPAYHLSQVLNQNLNTTFFDFVNKHRVDEAKSRMKEAPKITLLQIAYDSGFNNKTSFVNAFKKFEGTTPSQYLRSLN